MRNEENVVGHSFGLTHFSRIEEFLIMSTERIIVGLSSNNFFSKNPAINFPFPNQYFNSSVEAKDGRGCQRFIITNVYRYLL